MTDMVPFEKKERGEGDAVAIALLSPKAAAAAWNIRYDHIISLMRLGLLKPAYHDGTRSFFSSAQIKELAAPVAALALLREDRGERLYPLRAVAALTQVTIAKPGRYVRRGLIQPDFVCGKTPLFREGRLDELRVILQRTRPRRRADTEPHLFPDAQKSSLGEAVADETQP